VDWAARAEGFRRGLTPERRDGLASALGLPAAALEALPLIGFDAGAWTFPEVDARDRVIGIVRRDPSGAKRAIAGSVRGLVPIGPKAQALLAPYLLGREAGARCFSPREALAWQRERRAARKMKVQPTLQGRRVSAPKRSPGDGYSPNAYALAVARACLAAAVADLAKRRPDLLPPVREAEHRLTAARAEDTHRKRLPGGELVRVYQGIDLSPSTDEGDTF
jgi:hypothetical protein